MRPPAVPGGHAEPPPIRTATNTAGKPIKVGNWPSAIAITPNGKTAYVSAGNSSRCCYGRVVPIRIAAGKPGKTIKVGEYPGTIAITLDGTTAYVSAGNSSKPRAGELPTAHIPGPEPIPSPARRHARSVNAMAIRPPGGQASPTRGWARDLSPWQCWLSPVPFVA